MMYALYKLTVTALPVLGLAWAPVSSVAAGEPGGCGEEAKVVVVKLAGNSPAEGQVIRQVVASEAAPADENAGWLGVSLDEVNPALKAQLGLDDQGVMISNVVAGSPAEAAGLQRFDVVVAIDGKNVEGSVENLADMIANAGPGKQVQLDVIRSGENVSVHVKLGSRPAGGSPQWLHEIAPDGTFNQRLHTRGRVVMKGDDGEFKVIDMGDLDQLEDLPASVKALMPNFNNVYSHVTVDSDDGHKFKIKSVMERDGQRVEIEQTDDQGIVVRRTQTNENGKEVTEEKTYNDAEALRAGDAEAYELYTNTAVIRDSDSGFDFNFSFGDPANMKAFKFDLGNLQMDLHGAMEEMHKAFADANINFNAAAPGVGMFFSHAGKARQTFVVNDDGSIELRVRQGDSEVITKYDSAEDLEARNPDAYNKYRDVLDADVADAEVQD